MLRFDPDNLAQWGKGRWEIRPQEQISGFSIDTRNLGHGELFIAIKDKRDGHEGRDKKRNRDLDRKENGKERSPSPPVFQQRKVVYHGNEKKGKSRNKNDLRYLIKTVAKGKR